MKRVNNKVQIFFQKSFKNTDRNKIWPDRPGPAQDFSWAGPGRYVPRFLRAEPGRYGPRFQLGRAGQSGPKIYNPDRESRFGTGIDLLLILKWDSDFLELSLRVLVQVSVSKTLLSTPDLTPIHLWKFSIVYKRLYSFLRLSRIENSLRVDDHSYLSLFDA